MDVARLPSKVQITREGNILTATTALGRQTKALGGSPSLADVLDVLNAVFETTEARDAIGLASAYFLPAARSLAILFVLPPNFSVTIELKGGRVVGSTAKNGVTQPLTSISDLRRLFVQASESPVYGSPG